MAAEIRNDNTDFVVRALKAGIKDALDAVGAACEGYAKQACPVGTPESTHKKRYRGGTLKNSITHQMKDDKTVEIGTNVVYGKYVELGTRKMNAKPYLKPAVTNHSEEYRRLFQSILS